MSAQLQVNTPPDSNFGFKFGSKEKAPLVPNLSLLKLKLSKHPIRTVLLSSTVIFIMISMFFLDLPKFLKTSFYPFKRVTQTQTGVFTYPVNVLDIKFPSGFLQDQFLDNFKKAKETQDQTERYKLLEANFLMLRDFYISTHDPSLRKIGETYASYMAKNYSQETQKNLQLFTIPCLDKECGTPQYPSKIEDLKSRIEANSSLNPQVKTNILLILEQAAFSKDENSQWGAYLNALMSLKSAYSRTGDESIRALYNDLAAFMKDTYPQWGLPQ